MLVSVIISVYNGERYLRRSIDSVLNQTYKNFELLLLNDGSSDATAEIIRDYVERDRRIKSFENIINCGLTSCLNKLIEMSVGQLIARIDADDVWKPQKLEKQVKLLLEDNLDFVSCGYLVLDENGNSIPGKIVQSDHTSLIDQIVKAKGGVCHSSFLMRKNIVNEIDNYDESFIKAQDKDLLLRLVRANARFGAITSRELLLQQHKNQVSKERQGFHQSDYSNCAFFKYHCEVMRKNTCSDFECILSKMAFMRRLIEPLIGQHLSNLIIKRGILRVYVWLFC